MLVDTIRSKAKLDQFYLHDDYQDLVNDLDVINELHAPFSVKENHHSLGDLTKISNNLSNFWYTAFNAIRTSHGSVRRFVEFNQDLVVATLLARKGVNVVLGTHIVGPTRDFMTNLVYGISYADQRDVSLYSNVRGEAQYLLENFNRDIVNSMNIDVYDILKRTVSVYDYKPRTRLPRHENPLHLIMNCDLSSLRSVRNFISRSNGSFLWHLSPTMTTSSKDYQSVRRYVTNNTLEFDPQMLSMSSDDLKERLMSGGMIAVHISTDLDKKRTNRTLKNIVDCCLSGDNTILKKF